MKNLGYIFSESYLKSHIKKLSDDEVVRSEKDGSELTEVLFCVNPETGMPCGNLNSALSKQPLSVRRQILGELPQGTGSGGIDDADLVLETVKRNSETVVEYNDRMREVAKRELSKQKSEEC